MYQPPHFREDSLTVQHALIREFPLGLLITIHQGVPVANPVPFLLYENDGKGVLRCHVARANEQWQHINAGSPVLVVFQGVSRYITPSWYQTKQDTGKVVPTWNYATVQVQGAARVMDDGDWLLAQVNALTDQQEGKRQTPWKVSDAPDAYIASQFKGIIGIEIDISAIEGKWKVSQNRPEADVAGVILGLSGDADSHENSDMLSLVKRYGLRTSELK